VVPGIHRVLGMYLGRGGNGGPTVIGFPAILDFKQVLQLNRN